LQPIIPKYGPFLSKDSNGKPRNTVMLEDGTHISLARLMMINFLHAINFPKVFHVHHANEITDDDRLENFDLMKNGDHIKLHNPKLPGTNYSRNKNVPGFLEKMRNNCKRHYAKHNAEWKNDPIWREKIRERAREAYARRKDDPNYQQMMKNNKLRSKEKHKDDLAWQEKIKKRKHQYYLTSMSKPGAREKEAERVRQYRIKKGVANEISQS